MQPELPTLEEPAGHWKAGGSEELRNYRAERYRGDNMAVSLDRLAPRDQQIVRDLYRRLEDLLATLGASVPGDAVATRGRLQRWLRRVDLERLHAELRELGLQSRSQADFGLLGCAIHDARGGGLTGLLFHLETFDAETESERNLRSLYFYTRDQLKVLRSAFLDLDNPRREHDLLFRLHPISTVLEKLRTFVCFYEEREILLEVQSEFDGNIAASCCESAALDRVLHNCLRNACRHAADQRVRIHLFPVPDERGPNVRFVIANGIGAAESARLQALLAGRGPGALFHAGASTTGSGLGLTIVRDFVSEAFGLGEHDEAVRKGYVGVRVEDDEFLVFLHWPIAQER